MSRSSSMASGWGTSLRSARFSISSSLSSRSMNRILFRREPVRSKRGRPALMFSLTDRADAAFPKRYGQLATMVLNELAEIGGPELLDELFRRVADRYGGQLAGQVEGLDFDEKLRRV